MFQMGFANELFRRGDVVWPMRWNLTKEEMARGGYGRLRKLPVPLGWTGAYPYIVKVNTTGEYIVYADGSAQYLDYGTGSVSDPFQI